MGQPEPARPGGGGQRPGLAAGGVAVLSGLGGVGVVGVGGVHHQQVGPGGGPAQRRAGGGVGGIHHPDAPPGRAQHHLGGETVHRLPGLQRAPAGQRDAGGPGPLRVEPAGPGQGEGIAAAGHPVPAGEGFHLAPRHREAAAAVRQFHRVQGEGQRTGQLQHQFQQGPQPRRAGDGHRRGAPQRPLGLQQPRQAEDVVPVVVGQQDGIQLVQAAPPAPGGGLGALAAVEQQPAARHLQPQGGQRPAGQRLGAAAAQHGQFHHPHRLLSCAIIPSGGQKTKSGGKGAHSAKAPTAPGIYCANRQILSGTRQSPKINLENRPGCAIIYFAMPPVIRRRPQRDRGGNN